jgi:hypothetical protein
MINAKIFCDLIETNNYDALRNAHNSGELNAVKWSWVTRLNPSISLEEEYVKITGIDRPQCKVCCVNPVSSFISFAAGFNKYCSKSCAKRDPNVEQKKAKTLKSKPNWKVEALEKAKSTNMLKYGVTSPLKSPEILQRRRETNLSLYGSTEVLSAKSSIRNKITSDIAVNKVFSRVDNFSHVIPLFTREEFKTADDTYSWKCLGCSSIFYSALNDGNIPRCTRCNPKTSSAGEHELRKYVEDLLDEEVIQGHKLNSGLEVDIFVPSRKLGIEFNGIYWHSELAGKSKDYHINKKKECQEAGINLMQFWDTQWSNKKEIVKSIIAGSLGFNKKIYARKCIIKTVYEKESSKFLESNHLSGNAKGSFLRIGLYYDDNLICLATFSKPRFSKNETESIELLRFCTALNTTCVGGASKLISEAIKVCRPKKIISFCDEMCFNGSVYKNLNFVKISSGKPSSWYFSSDGILKHRVSFQKKKLLGMLNLSESPLTEWQLARELKLNRVWDCGNSKWELDVSSSR